MMKELAASLQKEGTPTLFITFNDGTNVNAYEKRTMTPLESIGVRIAWATSTDDTLQEVAEAANKSVDCLMFHDWVKSVSISKRTLADWLGNHPLVIFIDELNQRIAPDSTFLPDSADEEVADFLKVHFLARKQRYFAFSSHVAALGSHLKDYYNNASAREVYRPRIPQVTKLSDVVETGLCPAIHSGLVCWAGRCPALLTLAYPREPPSPERVENIVKRQPTDRFDTVRAEAIVLTAIEGDGGKVDDLGSFSCLLDVYGGSSACVWPPCYLPFASHEIGSSKNIAAAPELRDGFGEGLRAVKVFLDQLKDAEGSGKGWEGVAAAGLTLRLLYSHLSVSGVPTESSPVSPAAANLVPVEVAEGCKFGGFIQDHLVTAAEGLIRCFLRKMNSLFADGEHSYLANNVYSWVVRSTHSTYRDHGFFVFIKKKGV